MINRHFLLYAGLASIAAMSSVFLITARDDSRHSLTMASDLDPSLAPNEPGALGPRGMKTKGPGNDKFTAIKDPNPAIATIADRLERISKRHDMSQYSAEDIRLAIENPEVWNLESSASGEDLPLDESERSDGRSFFHASQLRVALSMPGDILEVSIPGGNSAYSLAVEQVGAPGNGMVTLKGKLQDMPGTFNITQGNNFAAGHINTNQGTYSFEMFGDNGWIHESGALFTGELPPVIDDDEHHHHGETLGDNGEHIIAKGHNSSTPNKARELTLLQE